MMSLSNLPQFPSDAAQGDKYITRASPASTGRTSGIGQSFDHDHIPPRSLQRLHDNTTSMAQSRMRMSITIPPLWHSHG